MLSPIAACQLASYGSRVFPPLPFRIMLVYYHLDPVFVVLAIRSLKHCACQTGCWDLGTWQCYKKREKKKEKSDGARNMSGKMIGLAVNMLTGEPGCLKRRILKVKADEPTPQILAVMLQ